MEGGAILVVHVNRSDCDRRNVAIKFWLSQGLKYLFFNTAQ